jgi:hypothetical protein
MDDDDRRQDQTRGRLDATSCIVFFDADKLADSKP